jgi:hypothetical protein
VTTRRILLVALLAALLLSAPTTALFMIALREAPESGVGRYQLLRGEYGLNLVDTTTGEAFRRDSEDIWEPIALDVASSQAIRIARTQRAESKPRVEKPAATAAPFTDEDWARAKPLPPASR